MYEHNAKCAAPNGGVYGRTATSYTQAAPKVEALSVETLIKHITEIAYNVAGASEGVADNLAGIHPETSATAGSNPLQPSLIRRLEEIRDTLNRADANLFRAKRALGLA